MQWGGWLSQLLLITPTPPSLPTPLIPLPHSHTVQINNIISLFVNYQFGVYLSFSSYGILWSLFFENSSFFYLGFLQDSFKQFFNKLNIVIRGVLKFISGFQPALDIFQALSVICLYSDGLLVVFNIIVIMMAQSFLNMLL